VVEQLVGNLLDVLQERLANSFFPLLQPAIGVGSAFEGWSPHGHDAVYRLLVPLKPPHGHTFHLKLSSAVEIPAKNCYVCVELECTCMKEQLVENTLCFLHHPKELRRVPAASILGTLCTGFYLDVLKTAQWFQNLVRSAWGEMPQSHHYSMKAIFTPSTMWAESYAVAEVKFFRHMARHAPPEALHLKCLQLFAAVLEGTSFSTYTLKTVMMHLLNSVPLERWSRREFLVRLQDILSYLHGCLEEKRLDHFFFGNENMPEDIILPPAFQTAEPINLFKRLVHDPVAHAKAMHEFDELQDR
ncbi:IPIL1 protein, partial [Ibidorhyncha struthersii]|nr:IPIL1 protein [Ibidorhyncha struthersii]